MREIFDKEIVTNPAKIADDFILALCVSDTERLPRAYNNALQLCNYISFLFASKESRDDFDSMLAEKYKKDPVLKRYKGNLENDLNGAIKTLERATKGDVLNDVEKNILADLLTITTMPLWHLRTSDFRQRKFSRSLIRT